MGIRIELSIRGEREIREKAYDAVELAAMDLVKDVVESGTMPYDTGMLQGSTYVEDRGNRLGVARVVSDRDYADKVYYSPDKIFSKRVNENAGGRWFEPYISGEKKEFVKEAMERYMTAGKGGERNEFDAGQGLSGNGAGL